MEAKRIQAVRDDEPRRLGSEPAVAAPRPDESGSCTSGSGVEVVQNGLPDTQSGASIDDRQIKTIVRLGARPVPLEPTLVESLRAIHNLLRRVHRTGEPKDFRIGERLADPDESCSRNGRSSTSAPLSVGFVNQSGSSGAPGISSQ